LGSDTYQPCLKCYAVKLFETGFEKRLDKTSDGFVYDKQCECCVEMKAKRNGYVLDMETDEAVRSYMLPWPSSKKLWLGQAFQTCRKLHPDTNQRLEPGARLSSEVLRKLRRPYIDCQVEYQNYDQSRAKMLHPDKIYVDESTAIYQSTQTVVS
jgi:hypothetical protein